mmetsp:Transcript_5448/g.9769  ORF Transcript_5448/g.9769 Transcript_5448/m.9769 type:complete len:132 (+) Transcript_5448:892-1287(+)
MVCGGSQVIVGRKEIVSSSLSVIVMILMSLLLYWCKIQMSHTVQELHMTMSVLISQEDGLHQKTKSVSIVWFVVALIMGHASLPTHASVLLAGQALIAVFLCASKLVFIMEIALIPTLARVNEGGLIMIAR